MSTVAPGARPLVGSYVRLDQAVDGDAAGLFEALDHDDVWASGYAGGPAARPHRRSDWLTKISVARTDGRAMYSVRLLDPASGAGTRIVGTSSLGDVDITNERVHLGWTAYAPDAWGTAVNPECKLLLMAHAFEECGFGRVKIQTDSINHRSQAAIAKLGATREGVLRRHTRRADGTFRDTVVFAVTIDDWPRVKAGLRARLEALSGPAREASPAKTPAQEPGTFVKG
jgi:RimJ/RimL family protein N-acetyltransferase